MVHSALATSTSGHGGQYSSRNGVQPSLIVIHHAATTSLSGVLSMMSTGSREVSANYVIKDAHVVSVVGEENSSWSLGDQSIERRCLTVETVNQSIEGWTISDASYLSLAKWVVDLSQRYGIPIDRDHVIGHREVYSRLGGSYPTACPGGIDLDRVVRMARELATVTQTIEELRGGAMTINIRDSKSGTVHVFGATYGRAEGNPSLANISNEMSLAAGGKGSQDWNAVQIEWAYQVVGKNAEAEVAALDAARARIAARPK